MDEKIKNAIAYVCKERSYYEERNCLAEISDRDDMSIKNDAANIFGDSYEEYDIIWNALLEV